MILACWEACRRVVCRVAVFPEAEDSLAEAAESHKGGNKASLREVEVGQEGIRQDLSVLRVVGIQPKLEEEVRNLGPFLPAFSVGVLYPAADPIILYLSDRRAHDSS